MSARQGGATVQILMAVYNGGRYLREQLDSLLVQTFGDWELLVSDDCSTDGSLDVLREYAERDERIRVVLEGEHYGAAKPHFMALLRLADAPYVMTCDQDDVWDADKVAVTLEAMRAEEAASAGAEPLLVCTDLRVVDESLRVLSPSFLAYSGMDASKLDFGYFLASCLVTGCTMMVNHPLLSLLREPVDEGALVMHDWWASLVAAAFGRVVHLDRATISYRQHGDNSVGADRFTVARALAALDAKRQTEREAVAQAGEFARVFGGRLDDARRSQLEAYLQVPQVSPLARVGLLGKAGVWRHGLLRNAGTLLTFLTLNHGKK